MRIHSIICFRNVLHALNLPPTTDPKPYPLLPSPSPHPSFHPVYILLFPSNDSLFPLLLFTRHSTVYFHLLSLPSYFFYYFPFFTLSPFPHISLRLSPFSPSSSFLHISFTFSFITLSLFPYISLKYTSLAFSCFLHFLFSSFLSLPSLPSFTLPLKIFLLQPSLYLFVTNSFPFLSPYPYPPIVSPFFYLSFFSYSFFFFTFIFFFPYFFLY